MSELPPQNDPAALSDLLAELQATAEQLGAQLGDLGRAGRDAAEASAEQVPALRRLLEVAPPELRARVATATTYGLTATRDLADWVLTQIQGETTPTPPPEELPIHRLPQGRDPDA